VTLKTWTSNPVTLKTWTSNPVTLKPLTSNLMTLKPLTSNPMTLKPLTSIPVTLKPLTSNPVTLKPSIKKTLFFPTKRKSVIAKRVDTHSSPYIYVFPLRTKNSDSASLDLLKSTNSFRKEIINDPLDQAQDKSADEIKPNIVLGNSIRRIPYLPLPTYPPEVYVNSEDLEFGFDPINSIPQPTSGPIIITTESSLLRNYSPSDTKSTSPPVTEYTSNTISQTNLVITPQNVTSYSYAKIIPNKSKNLVSFDRNVPNKTITTWSSPIIKSTLELAKKVNKENSITIYTPDTKEFYIRPETVESNFIPLTRNSKKIKFQTGDWRGLLEKDLPPELKRIQKAENA